MGCVRVSLGDCRELIPPMTRKWVVRGLIVVVVLAALWVLEFKVLLLTM